MESIRSHLSVSLYLTSHRLLCCALVKLLQPTVTSPPRQSRLHPLHIYIGWKNGSFQISTQNVQTGWSGLAIADLNGDGKDDIVVSNTVLENEPQPASGTITIFFSK